MSSRDQVSAKLFADACAVIPGGVNSPVRAFNSVGGTPRYITSAQGQVKSATMAAYPALIPNKDGWALLATEDPDEAKRQGMVLDDPNNAVEMIRQGRIKYRQLPVQQSLEDWNDFWSDYKGA